MRAPLVTSVVLASVIASAEASDDWFEARSDHFTAVSNGGEGRVESILEDLEQLRRLVTEIFPAQRVDGAKPAVFYLFEDEKSMRPFQPVVDGEREDWAGMYRPAPLRNYVLIRIDGSSEAARSMAFGQFTHLLGSYNDQDYPVWLSNGLSRFYGNTEISGKRASIGKMREDFRRVLGEFRSIPIRDLFAVDYSSDMYRDLGKRPLFDAQSWALVHYLLVGRLRENGPQRLGQYLSLIEDGREPLLAFQQAMGQTLDEIDQDVARYIRKSITQYLQIELPPLEAESEVRIAKLDEADVEGHLGALYAVTSQYEEALARLERAIELDPDQVLACEAIANLHDRRGERIEALQFLGRAIDNGSTNPHVHLRRAQLYADVREGDALSAEETVPVLESLRFVLREAPELTDAARLFGFLALFREEAREEAFEIVEQALARDRENRSLLFMLGQLHADDGSYAAARTIYRRLLEQKLDPQFNASVRRQLDFAEARIRFEVERRAAEEAAPAAAEAMQTAESDAKPEAVLEDGVDGDAVLDAFREKIAEARRTAESAVEVRGNLVQFECSNGHRFLVSAGDTFHTLEVAALGAVAIFENGEPVGTRDFYCGPLDEDVVVRYVPSGAPSEGSEKSGRLLSIDFLTNRP